MKTFWTIVLGLFLLVGCNNSSTSTLGNWVKKNAFEGGARGEAVSFVIDKIAYIGLGYNSDDDTNNGYLKDFWMYNPSTDKYTQIADFPGKGRVDAVGFSINGKGYVATGYDGENKLKDVWEYNPKTNTWAQKDDFLGGVRRYAVGFSLKNFGYVGTGNGSTMDKVDFYKFDPSAVSGSQWVKAQSISGDPRRGATAFTYNDKAYVCTGSSSYSKCTDMYEYDPSADSWTKKISLTDNSDWTIVRENASSFVLDNKAYVFLGSNNSSALKTCWEYDFAKDTWLEKTEFEGFAREFAVSFTVDGKAIVATGRAGGNFMYDVWEWRPFEESNTND